MLSPLFRHLRSSFAPGIWALAMLVAVSPLGMHSHVEQETEHAESCHHPEESVAPLHSHACGHAEHEPHQPVAHVDHAARVAIRIPTITIDSVVGPDLPVDRVSDRSVSLRRHDVSAKRQLARSQARLSVVLLI